MFVCAAAGPAQPYIPGVLTAAGTIAAFATIYAAHALYAFIGPLPAFLLLGATGLAAMLNAVRFNQIPSNAGIGLEMKVIAAVVVGGVAIRGGRGTVTGTLLGLVLLALIGPALVYLGISAYWERAIQGGIILAAVALDAWRARRRRPAVDLAVRAS